MELLKKKPIQSISIKELCQQAGINRGTFYKHYQDIYDLLQKMEDEMFAEFESALAPLMQLEAENRGPLAISTQIFQWLKDNSDLCTVTLGDYGDKAFADKLINYGRAKTMEAYLQRYKQATPRDVEYYYAFVSAGCIGLLRKWLDDGLLASAEEMAAMAERIMLYGIGFLERERG